MKLKSLIFSFVCVVLLQTGFVAASEPTTIYLTRHGETHWNVKKLWQGMTDTHLNLEGVQQAAEKAEFFKDMPIDAVYTSPLQRASLTGQIIASVHEKIVIPRFGLIEPSFGKLEGMFADDIRALIDARLNNMTQEERRRSGFLEGLLSPAMIAEQAEKELLYFGGMHPNGLIVAVSHSVIIKSIIAMHTDAIHESIKMSNMAYLKFSFDGEKLELVEISPDISYKTYE